MPLETPRRICGHHACSIIKHLNQSPTRIYHPDLNARSASIDGVFHEFLDS
jgi:hypothetical protein